MKLENTKKTIIPTMILINVVCLIISLFRGWFVFHEFIVTTILSLGIILLFCGVEYGAEGLVNKLLPEMTLEDFHKLATKEDETK